MKARNTLIYLLVTLFTPIYLTSCGEDRWAGYAEQTKTDRWIDSVMRVNYYWFQDIPDTKSLNYFIEPAQFFKSILSKEDKFSAIDSLKPVTRSIYDTDNSYGFQFNVSYSANDTAYYAHLMYVAHGSPAAQTKLERGDWIMEMNNKPITKKNYTRLYNGDAMNLTIGYYDAENDTIIAYDAPVAIGASRVIEDNPVFYHNVYTRGDKRIGYLVYNHFSFGPTDNLNNRPYDKDLLEASNYFASNQVNEFILDLRYNNGGYISCAQLLSTILAPAGNLGQELGYLQFNSQFSDLEFLNLNPELISGGTNLNLKRLYVLTSNETASASEMVINCLKPYMEEIVIIGQTTVGKNVGSNAFPNSNLMVVLHPIICKIFNSDGESDYTSGFSPDYSLNENNNLAQFLPFGNENELLLSKALSVIEGKDETVIPARSASSFSVISSSISRRATNAVRLK